VWVKLSTAGLENPLVEEGGWIQACGPRPVIEVELMFIAL